MNTLSIHMMLAGSLLALVACQTPASETRSPKRTMGGIYQGPERVFKKPVEEVMPALAGATATGSNGRVGPEFVFWSYRLADGRDVLFHACAQLDGVDCEARATRICAAGMPQPLLTADTRGDVRRMDCRLVGTAAPGDLRPNCSDFEFENSIVMGLSSCP